jgi:hypothetical protein
LHLKIIKILQNIVVLPSLKLLPKNCQQTPSIHLIGFSKP